MSGKILKTVKQFSILLRTQETYPYLALLCVLALALSSLQYLFDAQQLQLQVTLWSSTVSVLTAGSVLGFRALQRLLPTKFSNWTLAKELTRNISPTQKIYLVICAPLLVECSRISLLRIISSFIGENPLLPSILTAISVAVFISVVRGWRNREALRGALGHAIFTLIICVQFTWLASLWAAFLTSALLTSTIVYRQELLRAANKLPLRHHYLRRLRDSESR